MLAAAAAEDRMLISSRVRRARRAFVRTHVRHRHREKLVTAVAVVLDRRLVHFDERQRRPVHDPHRIWVIREQQPEVVVRALELRRPPEYPLLEPAVDLLEFGARDYQLRVRRYRPIALAPSLITDPVEKQRDAKEHAGGTDIP